MLITPRNTLHIYKKLVLLALNNCVYQVVMFFFNTILSVKALFLVHQVRFS